MFMYYSSPQVLKLLTEELIREARGARRGSARQTTARPSRFARLTGRLFARRTSPAPAACSC
jgi:hypothetical protein